jgi:hypothetical protein
VKLLLDENLPHKLRTQLPGHECFTAAYRGLEYEQDATSLPLAVVVLIANDNKLKTIEALVPRLCEALKTLKQKSFTRVQ